MRRTDIAVGLGLAVFLGCTVTRAIVRKDDVSDEDWRSAWRIVANAADKPSAGYPVPGWNEGEIGPDYKNRPYFEGEREGILMLHPVSANEPARIKFTGKISPDHPVLCVEISGSIHGDFVIECLCGGKKVGVRTIDGKKWHLVTFDLSAFKNQNTEVYLISKAGGRHLWSWEHCFIDKIYFSSYETQSATR